MAESDLDRIIREQRRRMATEDGDARRYLVGAYRRTIDSLEKEIEQFVRQVEAFPDSQWRRFHLQRLNELLALAEARFAAFTQDGASSLEAANVRAANIGALDAALLMTASGVMRGATINQPALERAIAAMREGSPLRDVLDGYGVRGRQIIEAKLTEAIAQGKGARKVIRELRRELGSGANRARLEALVRTETMRAYRGALHGQYATQGHLLAGLRWRASKSTRTCLACLAMDGKVFPVDKAPERFHVNCRCVYSPVPKGSTYRYERGEDWLRRQNPSRTAPMFPTPAAHRAWRDGRVDLDAFVGVKRSRKWGDAVYVKSARRVMEKQ